MDSLGSSDSSRMPPDNVAGWIEGGNPEPCFTRSDMVCLLHGRTVGDSLVSEQQTLSFTPDVGSSLAVVNPHLHQILIKDQGSYLVEMTCSISDIDGDVEIRILLDKTGSSLRNKPLLIPQLAHNKSVCVLECDKQTKLSLMQVRSGKMGVKSGATLQIYKL